VFDYYRKDIDYNYKPSGFVYDMIETLLPRAAFDSTAKTKRLKMLELYSLLYT